MEEHCPVAKNLMVMVLSDVKTDENGEVRLSDYPQINRKVKTTNESAVRLLHQDLQAHGQKIDRIYAFATQTVQGCITYRQEKDGEKTSLPYHYEGHEITHLDYTRKCMSDILSEDIWCIIPEPHLGRDNVSLAMNRTLSYTLRIAGRIQEDIEQMRKENPDVRIVLHADCTGGPRHAIMMLINIIRLLQYNDVEIGSLFYSNWISSESGGKIEQINDVYKFYNLIAGAEEFVNFGSVKDLQGYFNERSISPELDDLLLAMGEFADEVKLCRRWRFVDVIEHLQQAIETFERKWRCAEYSSDFNTSIDSNDNVWLNDLLMVQLLPQIHKDYYNLLHEHGPLTLIKWCLNQGLLQQALTLYTEIIPDFLFDTQNAFITITKDENRRAIIENSYRKKGKGYSWGTYFLIHYGFDNKEAQRESNSIYQKNKEKLSKKIKSLFYDLINNKADKKEAIEAFSAMNSSSNIVYIHNINRLIDIIDWTHALWSDAELINHPGKYQEVQKSILNTYWNEKNEDAIEQKKWLEVNTLKKRKSIYNFLTSRIRLSDIVHLAGGINRRGSFEVKWRIFDTGDFVIHVDPKKLYSIIDAYDIIRDERNHTNHAKEQEGIFDTAEDLIAFMQKTIREVESLRLIKGER